MDVGTIIFGVVVIAVICGLAWVFTHKRKDDDIPVGPLPPIPMPDDPSKPGPGILVPDDPIYKPEVDEVKVDHAVEVSNKVVEEPPKEISKVKPKPVPKPKRNQWPPPKRKR